MVPCKLSASFRNRLIKQIKGSDPPDVTKWTNTELSCHVNKMPHTYRVVKVKTGYKIKSNTKTLKRTFKSKGTANAAIRNLYKLAKGQHKKY